MAPVTPIALVGVSCRLPGGANSTDELWDLLERGGEAWSPVPADRFNEKAFYHPSADDTNGTSNHQRGHFIDGDVRDFDHSFFRLSPQQAAAMDPQQRILLEMSYEAFENAGWSLETLAGSTTAVYVAMFTTDFERNLYKDPLDLPVYYITGAQKAILAHTFDVSAVRAGADSGAHFLMLDDLPDPILSDPVCFEAVTALMKQPAKITGVSRTAHAENENLNLITIHAASAVLGNPRLLDMLIHVAARDGEPTQEREYRVRENGTVAVPRLRRSEKFNRAISATNALSTGNNAAKPLFVDDENAQDLNLDDDMIEIETQAFTLSESNLATPLVEYVGSVKRVGASVNGFAPGDRVAALGSVLGASRVRIPYTHAGRLSPEMPSATAAALLLSTMAAGYGLNKLAHLPLAGTVLIHGALTTIGRAAIAVARSIGVRITVTAADPAEARLLTDQRGIAANDVFISRHSLYRRSPRDVFTGGIDAIIQAGEDDVPTEALAWLKPFGSIVIMGASAHLQVAGTPKLPRNSVVHYCDIMELLQAHPDLTLSLVTEASAVFNHISIQDLSLCIRDISRVAEALRLINTGVHSNVVLQAEPDSVVLAAVPSRDRLKGWDNENASYVIAGGLGDLGRRLLFLMAQRGAKHLVTLSRRTPKSEDRRDLQARLREVQPGCLLYCLVCDITSETSVNGVAATLNRMGVPPDRTLDTMTYDDFRFTSRSKADGTLALERAFMSPSLDFFIMLTSAVNIVGASGQANYNAGNSVQDAAAQAHVGGSCHFMSLSLGWIEDAFHTADNEARLSGLRRAGLRPIRPGELSRCFDYALDIVAGKSRPAQAIIGFDAASLSDATAHNGTIHSAMFCHVNGTSTDTSVEASSLTLEQVLASGDPGFHRQRHRRQARATNFHRRRPHQGELGLYPRARLRFARRHRAAQLDPADVRRANAVVRDYHRSDAQRPS
ncbi:hypothetical protein AAE478_004593 [Parahypoxylon ruwenzoriense]